MAEPDRSVLLIHNPAARAAGGRAVAAVAQGLGAHGFAVAVRRSERAGHATALAADAGGFGLVIAAGGDGTVNEVIEGLPAGAPPLAVLPLGTANVLAAELGLDADPGRFVAAVVAGRCIDAWPGVVDGRPFMLMASAGFDAETVAAVSPWLKRRIGKAAYGVAAVRLWLAGRRRSFTVTVDGAVFPAAGVVVCKSRFYGGRFVLAPEAGAGVARLFVVLLPGGRRRDLLRYAWAMWCGRLHRAPGVRVLAAATVEIAAAVPAVVQVDGDARRMTPVAIALGRTPVRLVTGATG